MRGVFVTGTGTGVGKTVVAAAIARTQAANGLQVHVYKPVLSGLDDPGEPDHELLRRAAGSAQSDDEIAPHRFGPAVSPHLAARMAGERIDPGALLARARAAADGADALVCEGVGGYLVPITDDYLVRDLARDLALPVVIAASPGLGTINHTLLTLEAVRGDGLEVSTVILTPWPESPSEMERSNRETIARIGSAEVLVLPALDLTDPQGWPALEVPPPRAVPTGIETTFLGAQGMATPAHLDRSHVWQPFTQMRDWEAEDQLTIVAAEGCELIDSAGNRYLDGVSSLWCNVHGHRHPAIDAAIREQLEQVAHSTMLGLSHPRAEELADRLVEIAPRGLDRVFYSDSGSTAAEIALKMAFQYWQQRGGQHVRRTKFVGLRGAYHGDTIGSVSVGGIDLFHGKFGPLLFGTHQAQPGDIADMARLLGRHEEEIAAVIVEPLVQGAAGILTHPPGYLRAVRELCDQHGILLICDEVATGFGRTGTMFACEREGVAPDLMCLAKGLTGGYMPLAATLATEEIYAGFLGAHEDFRTFFHGHTYTGNPLACAAALASIDVFKEERTLFRLQDKIRILGESLEEVAAMEEVAEVRRCGTMVGIDLGEHDPALRTGHKVTLEARRRGVIVRPLGDVVVLMPPLSISKEDLRRLVAVSAESIVAARQEHDWWDYEAALTPAGGGRSSRAA